jgi:predicted DNA-binding protein (MmcQ/YjbR family)
MPDPEWNPYFRALWKHCSAKPSAREDHPWGETVFKVGDKILAFLGTPDQGGVGVKVSPEQIESLLRMPFIKRSPYIGRYGWLSVSVDDDDALELALELVDGSYEQIAAKSKGARKASKSAATPKKQPTKTPPKKSSAKKPSAKKPSTKKRS